MRIEDQLFQYHVSKIKKRGERALADEPPQSTHRQELEVPLALTYRPASIPAVFDLLWSRMVIDRCISLRKRLRVLRYRFIDVPVKAFVRWRGERLVAKLSELALRLSRANFHADVECCFDRKTIVVRVYPSGLAMPEDSFILLDGVLPGQNFCSLNLLYLAEASKALKALSRLRGPTHAKAKSGDGNRFFGVFTGSIRPRRPQAAQGREVRPDRRP